MTATSSPPASPLYITVGPPCGGKTSWLRERDIQDIAIDDQPNVYYPLPWTYFALDHVIDKEYLLNRTLVGKTIRERLYDAQQCELRTVCACLSGKMNPQRMQHELERQFIKEQGQRRRNNSNNSQDTVLLASVIASAVADVLRSSSSRTSLPPTVDLFCVDALFARNGENAIERAYQTLEAIPTTQSVAWGNTNIRFSDYQRALEMAYTQQRPVHFVLFDSTTQICIVANATTRIEYNHDDVEFCLDELMTRNIKRLLETGRYIPVGVVKDMLTRYLDIIRRCSSGDDLLQTLMGSSRFIRDSQTGLLKLKNINNK